MKKIFCLVLCISMSLLNPVTSLAKEDQEIVVDDGFLQIINEMNEDPVEFETIIENGGYYEKTYVVETEDGIAEATLTFEYTDPVMPRADDYWSGNRVAPAIGSTTEITWNYISPNMGGFLWWVKLKRPYENKLEGDDSRLVFEPPVLYTVVHQTSFFENQTAGNKVTCRGEVLEMFGLGVPTPVSYYFTARFTLLEDTIAYQFEYD